MASVNDSFVNSIALTIRAVEKINQVTGGRDAIVRKSASGGSALSNVIVSSIGQSSGGASEVGNGNNVNTSA